MNRLTRQEQIVLCVVLSMLLTGWAVKAYRAARPTGETRTVPTSNTTVLEPGERESD